jgi:hypothetical protein
LSLGKSIVVRAEGGAFDMDLQHRYHDLEKWLPLPKPSELGITGVWQDSVARAIFINVVWSPCWHCLGFSSMDMSHNISQITRRTTAVASESSFKRMNRILVLSRVLIFHVLALGN